MNSRTEDVTKMYERGKDKQMGDEWPYEAITTLRHCYSYHQSFFYKCSKS